MQARAKMPMQVLLCPQESSVNERQKDHRKVFINSLKQKELFDIAYFEEIESKMLLIYIKREYVTWKETMAEHPRETLIPKG